MPPARPYGVRIGYTKEQRWCGVWYDCAAFRCGRSALIPSAELRAQLKEQSNPA
jgi:hypothetical protein